MPESALKGPSFHSWTQPLLKPKEKKVSLCSAYSSLERGLSKGGEEAAFQAGKYWFMRATETSDPRFSLIQERTPGVPERFCGRTMWRTMSPLTPIPSESTSRRPTWRNISEIATVAVEK